MAEYEVMLKTEFGVFDVSNGFGTLKEAKAWAKGRHQYQGSDGKWKNYEVIVFKDTQHHLTYKTK